LNEPSDYSRILKEEYRRLYGDPEDDTHFGSGFHRNEKGHLVKDGVYESDIEHWDRLNDGTEVFSHSENESTKAEKSFDSSEEMAGHETDINAMPLHDVPESFSSSDIFDDGLRRDIFTLSWNSKAETYLEKLMASTGMIGKNVPRFFVDDFANGPDESDDVTAGADEGEGPQSHAADPSAWTPRLSRHFLSAEGKPVVRPGELSEEVPCYAVARVQALQPWLNFHEGRGVTAVIVLPDARGWESAHIRQVNSKPNFLPACLFACSSRTRVFMLFYPEYTSFLLIYSRHAFEFLVCGRACDE
jgi:hypothetical protein